MDQLTAAIEPLTHILCGCAAAATQAHLHLLQTFLTGPLQEALQGELPAARVLVLLDCIMPALR